MPVLLRPSERRMTMPGGRGPDGAGSVPSSPGRDRSGKATTASSSPSPMAVRRTNPRPSTASRIRGRSVPGGTSSRAYPPNITSPRRTRLGSAATKSLAAALAASSRVGRMSWDRMLPLLSMARMMADRSGGGGGGGGRGGRGRGRRAGKLQTSGSKHGGDEEQSPQKSRPDERDGHLAPPDGVLQAAHAVEHDPQHFLEHRGVLVHHGGVRVRREGQERRGLAGGDRHHARTAVQRGHLPEHLSRSQIGDRCALAREPHASAFDDEDAPGRIPLIEEFLPGAERDPGRGGGQPPHLFGGQSLEHGDFADDLFHHYPPGFLVGLGRGVSGRGSTREAGNLLWHTRSGVS